MRLILGLNTKRMFLVFIPGWKHSRMRGEGREEDSTCGNCIPCKEKAQNLQILGFLQVRQMVQADTELRGPATSHPPCTSGVYDMSDATSTKSRRNTPACAGKTKVLPPCHRGVKKHPRMRGEDRSMESAFTGGTRNTPACAGKTLRWRQEPHRSGKHPRMRGEDLFVARRTRAFLETPPHARGRPDFKSNQASKIRNTPACAGKTRPLSLSHSALWKHPRMRGEDRLRHCLRLPRQETPPHARGRLASALDKLGKDRNTPACAGKTRAGSPASRTTGKHPRMRGED